MTKLSMEKLVNYCKQYGFIFQGSEIYGGLANTWDYGPLGSRIKIILKIRGANVLFKNALMPTKLMQQF